MKRAALTCTFLVICSVFSAADRILTVQAGLGTSPLSSGGLLPQIRPAFGKLPLSFIPNRGQIDGPASFYVQGKDKTIYFSPEGVSFVLGADAPDGRWAVKLEFIGSNPGVRPAGRDETGAVVSYFRGPADGWKTGLPLYSRIVYANLWPGIDLVFSGAADALKYEFVVLPGADPSLVRLAYRGASEVRVGETGGLIVATPAGSFEDGAPSAYQNRPDGRDDVPLAFDLAGGEVGFKVGEYDRSRTLVLDPVIIVYCGYIGGPGLDHISGIAADPAGNVYVTGFTASAGDFPAAAGPDPAWNGGTFDAFVAKVDPTGSALLYCGYIGGAGDDYAYGLALDAAGSAYIAGYTSSTEATFPAAVGPGLVHRGGFDAFVAKINPAGTALEYCGYIGGTGQDYGRGIAVDAWNRAYVAGSTLSGEGTFPVKQGPVLTYGGGRDAFIARVSVDGRTLEYCGYVGGGGEDAGLAVAVDPEGRAYLAGHTNSSENSSPAFPAFYGPDTMIGGGFDGFIACLNPAGTDFEYCGYIGGAGDDYATGVAVDRLGQAHVVGTTSSPESSFPIYIGPDVTYNGGAADAFVAKVRGGGALFAYYGYIGGADYDAGSGIAVDDRGYAFVAGYTSSSESSFPVRFGPNPAYSGSFDAFVARIDASGYELGFSGYLGGFEADYGTAIAIGPEAAGLVFLAGNAYSAESSFPAAVGPALAHRGGRDGFVAAIFERSITLTSPNGGEYWPVGLPQDITWDSDGGVGDVRIEFSSDGGQTWEDIVALTANDGLFVWLVPEAVSSACRVRISEADEGDPSDTSRVAFIISGDPAVRLTSPNGGERWRVGSTQTITWLWGGNVGDVRLELSTDDAATWTEIATVENTGSHVWVVPDAPSETCWVRISDALAGLPIDLNDKAFAIVGPSLRLTAPNGGETWAVGSSRTITWTWTDQVGDVRLELSTDDRTSWTDIAVTENDGSYVWIVPDRVSETCWIRISEAADGHPEDVSDAAFAIVAPEASPLKQPGPAGIIRLGLLLFPMMSPGPGPLPAAQTASGTIQGIVLDSDGRSLVGAAVFLSSPAMQGQRIALTGKRGGFDFPSLPAGAYVLSVEMPDFITLVQDGISLRSGESRFIRISLTPSEEETTVKAEAARPSLDPISPKNALVRGRDLLVRLPLAKDFRSVLETASGVVEPGFPFPREAAFVGGTSRDNVILLDGADLTDVFSRTQAVDVSLDLLEEVEVVTAGRPASMLPAGGSVVNIVTRSGGNAFTGGLGLQLMSGGLAQKLWTPEEVGDLVTAPPGGDKNLFEPSLSLGGTFWPDRAWYFLSGRFSKKSQRGLFIGPFRDAAGRLHESYDWSRQDLSGFFKLTVRPIAEARFAAWVHLADAYLPVAEAPSARLPFLSTSILDHERSLSLFATVDYALRPSTTAFFRGAYMKRRIPTRLQAEAEKLAWTDDAADLYGPIGGAAYNSDDSRQRLQGSAAVRQFAEGLLGTTHTLGAGVDFDDGTTSFSWWRADNLRSFLDSRYPGNAYYGDRGLLGFWLCGAAEGSTLVKARSQILGAYVTDTFPVGRRLTVDLGLRFDWSRGWHPAGYKLESGNALSRFIGDAVLSPRLAASWPEDFPIGFNPLDQLTYSERKDLLSWTALTPRAGLTWDLFGKGKTLLKASYARYAEPLAHRYFLPLHPLYPRDLSVTWWDVNGDGRADAEDEFGLFDLDYRMISGADNVRRIADGLKAPATEEISAGLEHELTRDFSLGLRVLSRTQTNILEDVLTVADTGEVWYAAGQPGADKYWLPFTTTVPGTGVFPDVTVTLFARSLQSPPSYLQLRNVPELERKSRALELTFRKRLSRGWLAAGSAVFSKSEGNIGGFSAGAPGLTEAGDGPNYFVNRYGRLDTDRPLTVNLMAGLELPLDFLLSGTFVYRSGRPWQRWVQVLPPADWCAANRAERTLYAVNLEASGSRREKAWSTIDLRIEKTWPVGPAARLGLAVDVVNLLGYRTSVSGLNDADRWLPSAEGAGRPGQKFVAPDFGLTSALYGARLFRLGLKLGF